MDDMETPAWIAWGLDKKQAAIEDKRPKKTPPSKEAMDFAIQAQTKLQNIITSIKRTSMCLSKTDLPRSKRVYLPTLEKAMTESKEIDTKYMGQLDEIVCMGATTWSDSAVRSLLNEMAKPYQTLEAWQLHINLH